MSNIWAHFRTSELRMILIQGQIDEWKITIGEQNAIVMGDYNAHCFRYNLHSGVKVLNT